MKKPQIRCAIYTRKSSEEGLDQAFNSLDAQRESAEAYIKSQSSEGWMCLPQTYDDGGFTGGNMDRPGLKKIMDDIRAGKIDAVVVYKVDRLSRSLIDFARMMEVFERHNVSFVSVTQRFSTVDSMGRLTLNMLLSFAQFEREIISERTRDKIAAARRKGKWSGGRPILGYDIDSARSSLVANETEVPLVRRIFDLYLKHEALIPVISELDQMGLTTKAWITRKGKAFGGKSFDKHLVYMLLRNVAYIGKVRHKENVYEGEHDAIVDAETFQRVQAVLDRNGTDGGGVVRNRYGALLKGILKCEACDCSMGFTYASGKGAGNSDPERVGTIRYCYYVCRSAQRRGWATCASKSVQASVIEEFVLQQLRNKCQAMGCEREFEHRWEVAPPLERPALLRSLIDHVTYHGEAQRVRIRFHLDALTPQPKTTDSATSPRTKEPRRARTQPAATVTG